MILGFQSRFVEAVCNQDGRNFKLLTPIVYKSRDGRVFIVPRGASTDGASTPALIASLLPPTGDYWQSAILHDSAYQNTLETDSGAKAALSKDECDYLLKEAMELSGVDAVTAETIYEGVRIGGWLAFKADRS